MMASDEEQRDLRKFPRIRVRLGVEYRIGGQAAAATTENISEGGVFVTTEAPVPVGTALRLRLSVPGEDLDEGELEGQVTRVVELCGDPIPDHIAGMGIEFKLTPEQRERLRGILVRHGSGPIEKEAEPEPEPGAEPGPDADPGAGR